MGVNSGRNCAKLHIRSALTATGWHLLIGFAVLLALLCSGCGGGGGGGGGGSSVTITGVVDDVVVGTPTPVGHGFYSVGQFHDHDQHPRWELQPRPCLRARTRSTVTRNGGSAPEVILLHDRIPAATSSEAVGTFYIGPNPR